MFKSRISEHTNLGPKIWLNKANGIGKRGNLNCLSGKCGYQIDSIQAVSQKAVTDLHKIGLSKFWIVVVYGCTTEDHILLAGSQFGPMDLLEVGYVLWDI